MWFFNKGRRRQQEDRRTKVVVIEQGDVVKKPGKKELFLGKVKKSKKVLRKDKKKSKWQEVLSLWLVPLKNFGIGEERQLFLENLAMLLASGMSVLDALDSIKAEVRTRRMKIVLDTVKNDISNGQPFWRAIDDVHILKSHVVALLRLGEDAGRLVENLEVIVLQQQKERSFRSKLRSAMAYPLLVMGVALLLGFGLVVFILPRLENVFGSLHLDLPVITRVLLSIGAFMKVHGAVVIPTVMFLVIVVTYVFFVWRKTRILGQWILWRLPGVRRLIKEVELARFGYILGTLLEAGLPIVQAISSVRDATLLYNYRDLYGHIVARVEIGESIKSSLGSFNKSRKLIPPSIQQMIVAGEQSGRLAESLIKIGQIYETKTETTSKNLTTILEPLLLVVVWVGVSVVALAVIMPIYSLIGGLNDARTQPANQESAVVEDSIVPTGEGKPSVTPEPEPRILRVIETGVGYLNVRAEPEIRSLQIDRVIPGDVFEFDDSEEDEDGVIAWYHIILESGDEEGQESEDIVESGWVSAQFVELLNESGEVVFEEIGVASGESEDNEEGEVGDESVDGAVEGANTFEEIDFTPTAEELNGLENALGKQFEDAVARELKRRLGGKVEVGDESE